MDIIILNLNKHNIAAQRQFPLVIHLKSVCVYACNAMLERDTDADNTSSGKQDERWQVEKEFNTQTK